MCLVRLLNDYDPRTFITYKDFLYDLIDASSSRFEIVFCSGNFFPSFLQVPGKTVMKIRIEEL